jgi:hypothetical protein
MADLLFVSEQQMTNAFDEKLNEAFAEVATRLLCVFVNTRLATRRYSH